MPLDNKSGNDPSLSPPLKKAKAISNQATLAMELPFTFVGAVAAGGLIGYYLDRALHTGPWMMVLFGGFGFVAGVMEIARRLGPGKSGNGSGSS
jgi:F0F1-type ATP synthase assembly protein I